MAALTTEQKTIWAHKARMTLGRLLEWFAVIDHTHEPSGPPLGNATPSVVQEETGTPGTSTNASREDHAHQGATGGGHTRLHSVASTLDHSSIITLEKMIKADEVGLPVEATNSDAEVADAVTKAHANTLDHSNSLDHSNANDPTAGEKSALAGTSGTPGTGNKYVTDGDARNTDSRAPTTHSHAPGDVTGTAVVTNDSRLSDARTPVTHDSTKHSVSYEAANSNIQTHVTGSGSPHTAAGVGAEAAGAVATHAALTASIHGSDSSGKYPSTPTLAGAEASGAVSTHNGLTGPHASATSVGGKSIPSGGIADASTLSTHTGAAAPHSGHVQVGGQIGGTAASPDVRGIRESGATLLTLGAVADNQYLKRSGTTLIGATPAGGANPAWWGVLYAAQGDCDPVRVLGTGLNMVNSVAGPTPTAITASLARCVQFVPPANITINRVKLFGVAATTGLYKFAIYPVGAGSARTWESGAVTSVANTWLAISAAMPITLTAGVKYWFCVTVTSTGTTAGFRSVPAPIHSAFWAADAVPLGGRTFSLPVCAQFAVTAGAFPATLPAIAAAAYGAGATGSVPLAFLDNVI